MKGVYFIKKFSSIWLALAACLLSLLFTGCPGLFQKHTVTFYDEANYTDYEYVLNGMTCPKPTDPEATENYFLYWSESYASNKEAKPFDFNTPITSDKTLYAVYAPKFASEPIKELTYTEIKIALYSKYYLYPLTDGSYAGIKLSHSSDGTTWKDVELTAPTYTEKTHDGNYQYYTLLTYSFSTSLAEGTNYFKISNGHDEDDIKSINYIQPENARKVTFIDGNSTLKTVVVAAGSPIAYYDKPSNPTNDYNYFMYWSKSRASQAEAVEFDFDSEITEDTTLYAIYTPELTSSYALYSLTNTKIVVYLGFSKKNYSRPLDDGSYAGIKFQYSTDDTTYTDYDLSIPEEDEENYYLTYKFKESLAAGTHYFKLLSNGTEIGKKSTTVYAPAPATDLAVAVNDRYAKVTFTPANGYNDYTVKVFQGSTEVASKSVSCTSNGNAEFYGLTNGTEYTFKVLTDGTDKYAEVNATPAITKKESDWIVALYMDGDNNLHNQIWADLNEVEKGIYDITYSNGSTLSGYSTVNVVALWDGVTSYKDIDSEGNEITVNPTTGRSGTYLFEVGRDYTIDTKLSEDTKNLSYTADWIYDGDIEVSTSKPNVCGELNMGDKQTLINYLNWVNAHYTAKKGIILQFSDHGGGPRSVRYVQTPDGRTIKIGDTSGRRALCWDDSSSANAFLKTSDVSYALKEAGFGTDNKLAMILMDVCLGSSIEDAYEFKDYAEYLAASPNTIPGSGLDYTKLIKSFKSSNSIKLIGKQILEDYKDQYHTTAYWNYYAQQYQKVNYYSLLTQDQKNILDWISDYGVTTFTITDLDKVEEVKTAINHLCDVLLSDEGKAKTVYVDANGEFSPSITDKTTNFVKYFGDHNANVVNLFNGKAGYYINDSMYYQGTFTWLYDIGYIAKWMSVLSADTVEGSPNANAWSKLNTVANTVLQKLDTAIKYSWRDSGLVSSSDNYDFYYNLDSTSDYDHYFGLTICGAEIGVMGGHFTDGTAPDFYKTDLAFGKDSKWGDLLEYWFGTGN